MLIRVGFDISFHFPAPTAMVFMLYLHPSRQSSVRQPERLTIDPQVPITEFHDGFGNRCGRVFVPAGNVKLHGEAVVEDHGRPEQQHWDIQQWNVQDLPHEVLPYLYASRYCEVDSELKNTAWAMFGQMLTGWLRVQAICNFVHQHIRFDYQQARANRTALEVYRERAGVCRDYTHLAIAFCRSLNIPARYCTGYLGDIGVPTSAQPMDFSAWFEAYLGGEWYAFDARNNLPRVGRVLMARGRDAADVALTTIFGLNTLTSFQVITQELPVGVSV